MIEIETTLMNKIGKAIRTEFTDVEIKTLYKDQTPQNFTKPCIVILEYDSQEEHLFNSMRRHYIWYDLTIHLDTTTSEQQQIYTKMRTYANRISRVLDYIDLTAEETSNRACRLKKQEWKSFVKDGVGHCQFMFYYHTSNRIPGANPIKEISGTNKIKK